MRSDVEPIGALGQLKKEKGAPVILELISYMISSKATRYLNNVSKRNKHIFLIDFQNEYVPYGNSVHEL